VYGRVNEGDVCVCIERARVDLVIRRRGDQQTSCSTRVIEIVSYTVATCTAVEGVVVVGVLIRF